MSAPLPDDVRALLAAAVDALTVPLADRWEDDATRAELLDQRTSDTRIILAGVLRGSHIGDATDQLRQWTARRPVTYTSWAGREPAEQDGGA